MKATAKHDVKILMEDGRFSNFRKGNEYRCMRKGDEMVLIDENKCGYICAFECFDEDFEIVESGD